MRIVFFGSDDFAATHLEYLLKSRHAIVGCVTQPDARQGRGLSLVMSPIKAIAAKYHIDCIQPDSLKDVGVVERLKEFNSDLFVVVAYGKLLTKEILALPKIFCINVHGSLLPQYRGAAPINWAIINGDRQTGVTVQKMALALDDGDIISQSSIDIALDMTADVLRLRLADLGALLLTETIDRIENNQFQLTPQSEETFTYASKLTKEMGRINWHDSAQAIYNKIRGLKPWPGTYTLFNQKTLKIIQAMVVDRNGQPGQVIAVDKNSFTIACGQGSLLIKEVQPEAGKVMSASSFMAGYKIQEGINLGV